MASGRIDGTVSWYPGRRGCRISDQLGEASGARQPTIDAAYRSVIKQATGDALRGLAESGLSITKTA
jgi:hypothetical protein